MRTLLFVATALLASCTSPAPTKPRAIVAASGHCTQPPYPAEARESAAEGTTTLEYEVSAEGKVTRVAVTGTSGPTPAHKILDALALTTTAKCTFPAAPGFLPASARIQYVWKLGG